MNLITPEYEEWGRTAKKALIDRKMSVIALSRQLKINKLYISSAMNGRRPDARVIRLVSEYLGIDTPM